MNTKFGIEQRRHKQTETQVTDATDLPTHIHATAGESNQLNKPEELYMHPMTTVLSTDCCRYHVLRSAVR